MGYLVFILMLTGCTISKDNKMFNDIPPTIHHVYFGEMLNKCYKYTPFVAKIFGAIPLACTEWDINKNTCDIYISENAPNWMLEHELNHCKGYGH